MPTKTNMIPFWVVSALTLVLWAWVLVDLNQVRLDHDIGTALLDAALLIAVWVLLAVLLAMGAMKGEMPGWAKVLAWILHPASLAAAMAVLDSSGTSTSPKWLLVVPAVAPLAMVAYAGWALFPSFHAAMPAAVSGSSVWGVVFVLAVAPWVRMIEHTRQIEAGRAESAREYVAAAGQAARPENLEKLKQLTDDTPLWEWREFTAPEMGVREEAFAGIHKSKRRQKDAEDMLAQGVKGFLVDLPDLDLEVTPAIVAGHKAYLQDLVAETRREDAGRVKYSWVASEVDRYLPSIEWMAVRHCGCSAEMAALEASIRAYKNSPGKAECLAALAKARAAEKE